MNEPMPAPSVPPPPAARRRNPVIMVVGIVAGVAAIYFGVKQIMGAWHVDEDATAILKSVNVLVDEGNKQTTEAATLHGEILNAVDSDGLDTVRKNRAADGAKAEKLFTGAAASYRAAADKCVEGANLGVKDFIKDYFNAKAECYRQMAVCKEAARDMITAVFDPAVKDTDTLLAKITEARTRVDQATAISNKEGARGDQIAKDHPENLK